MKRLDVDSRYQFRLHYESDNTLCKISRTVRKAIILVKAGHALSPGKRGLASAGTRRALGPDPARRY